MEDVRVDVRSLGRFGSEIFYRMVHKLTGVAVEGKAKVSEGHELQTKLIKELQQRVEAK